MDKDEFSELVKGLPAPLKPGESTPDWHVVTQTDASGWRSVVKCRHCTFGDWAKQGANLVCANCGKTTLERDGEGYWTVKD